MLYIVETVACNCNNSIADAVWLAQPVPLKWLTKAVHVFQQIYRKVVIRVDEQLQEITI
jgi:hypothetical protein